MAGDPHGAIRLELPNDARFLRVARLVAGGVASAAGMGVDNVDDMRIAVDELCAALVEVGDGGALELRFVLLPHAVEVEGRTAASVLVAFDPERLTLSEQILKVACDHYTLAVEGGVASFTLRKTAG
jgi:serine/threonine-protein kinase RsbW